MVLMCMHLTETLSVTQSKRHRLRVLLWFTQNPLTHLIAFHMTQLPCLQCWKAALHRQ